MTSRARRAPPPPLLPPPSKCAKFLYYTWKLCSVVFSHLVMISLVVAYCILGAVTFERLEADHEREVKRNISQIRRNTTASIWDMTRAAPLLNQTHWTGEVVLMLQEFENSLVFEMKGRGWDGAENTDHLQWNFTGALFYSIIVITTIGYGHITPKTQTGKVVTIFYAILGIPLMLLCLSNIGDVMASSFRFLYWRVCCYVCTRPPPRRRRRSARRSVRARPGSARRRARPLERAHSDTDFRYRDSGYSSGRARRPRPPPPRPRPPPPRTRSQPPLLPAAGPSFPREDSPPSPRLTREDLELDDYDQDNEKSHDSAKLPYTEVFPKISLPLQNLAAALQQLDEHQRRAPAEARSRSLPRRTRLAGPAAAAAADHDLDDVDYQNFRERKVQEQRERPDDGGYDPEDEDFEFDAPRYHRTWDDRRRDRGRSEYHEYAEGGIGSARGRRARSAAAPDWRRGPDAMQDWRRGPDTVPDWRRGCDAGAQEWRRGPDAPRARQLRRLQTIDDTGLYDPRYTPSPVQEEWTDEEAVVPRREKPSAWSSRQLEVYSEAPEPTAKEMIKPVPIWLCVLLVASYIVAGTFLFKSWEGWAYLDSAYFCFITLTTIGFGDFVPAQGRSGDAGLAAAAVHSFALCSLYLLFGIALLAMSFNLVQEEVRANVAALATRLGIIKPERGADSDGDSAY